MGYFPKSLTARETFLYTPQNAFIISKFLITDTGCVSNL